VTGATSEQTDTGLPNRVGLRRDGDTRRFANGLVIHCEPFFKADRLRILGVGGPQSAMMNHLLSFPEVVQGRRVFEPFAGSGAIGFMALKAGATHVDFLDVNPRAAEFHRRSAKDSGIPADQYTSITASIGEHVPDERYDLVLANPPFVPTPKELTESITSYGGPDGNDFIRILLEQIDSVLEPSGDAFYYCMQVVRDGRPLIMDLAAELLPDRSMDLTLSQRHPIPLGLYKDAFLMIFPVQKAEIERWADELEQRHGPGLVINHYIAHIRPVRDEPPTHAVRDDHGAKYGNFACVPSDDLMKLAQARVLENLVPETQEQEDALTHGRMSRKK
jgi:hypothetical protein